jgi:hypothetical protein
MNATATQALEPADLKLLSLADAQVVLQRFGWLSEFLMCSPGTATDEEARLLFQVIEILEERVSGQE